MIVLGIETSCDETSVGIVEIDDALNCSLLANVVATSLDLHKLYGGVVPEIAARSHIESMMAVVDEALEAALNDERRTTNDGKAAGESPSKIQDPRSRISSDPWDKVDAIAVTYGAGLGGSLLVGVMTARTLAIAKNKPLYAVNHVMGHVYANFITGVKNEERRTKNDGKTAGAAPSKIQDPRSKIYELQGKEYIFPEKAPEFPMLAVIVSGGHSQLALFKGHFDYELLGKTRDDAMGEAYDKVAKITGLPYPGGPSVDIAAKAGDPNRYNLPKPKLGPMREKDVGGALLNDERRTTNEEGATEESKKQGVESKEEATGSTLLRSKIQDPRSSYDFSFSGLKTAVLRLAQAEIGEDFTFPSFKIAERLSKQQQCDIAASFQRVSIEIIADKVIQAYREFKPRTVVLAGGVAASPLLRRTLEERLLDIRSQSSDLRGASLNDERRTKNEEGAAEESNEQGTEGYEEAAGGALPSSKFQDLRSILQYPDMKLCTDNGAMIATLGCFMAMLGQPPADPYSLEIAPNLTM